MTTEFSLRGMRVHPGALDNAQQSALLDALRAVVRAAPLFAPQTRQGPMSVRMTSAGALGWIADHAGYRYVPTHPSGTPWPPIPETALRVWRDYARCKHMPDTCLINFYDARARMGLHQDKDEADMSAPVVSISLGDDALFRIGNQTRGGQTESLWLRSGDVLVLEGESRLRYHGIDKLRAGSSTLLAQGGRVNITLRVAR